MKDNRTLALESYSCSIPVKLTCRYRYRLVMYRYRFATGAFLYGCTGTGWPLLISGIGVPVQVRAVPVQVRAVPVQVPLHLFPIIVALLETSLSGFHHPQ